MARLGLRAVWIACFLAVLGSAPARGQHLSVEPMAAVTDPTVGHTRLAPLDNDEFALEDQSDSLIEPERSSVRRLLASRDGRMKLENWLVVSVLGLGFAFGLVVTVATTRQQVREEPRRLF